ncbi:MAG: hypothetical protein ACK55Z_04105, partial [bacterium]
MVLARFDGRDEFVGLPGALEPSLPFIDAAPVLCPEAQLAAGLGLGAPDLLVAASQGPAHPVPKVHDPRVGRPKLVHVVLGRLGRQIQPGHDLRDQDKLVGAAPVAQAEHTCLGQLV